MKHTLPRRFLLLVAGLAMFTLAGCATMRPISSPPPVAKIVLAAPFSTSAWAGLLPPIPYSVILPPGEYHPLYEDDQYYYYQAPSKVVVNELGSSMYDGGIYVLRGTTTPRGWYYICADGSQSLGPFSTPPPTR
jgi:hypothetical protein